MQRIQKLEAIVQLNIQKGDDAPIPLLRVSEVQGKVPPHHVHHQHQQDSGDSQGEHPRLLPPTTEHNSSRHEDDLQDPHSQQEDQHHKSQSSQVQVRDPVPDNLLPQSYPPIQEKTPVPIIPHPNQHQSDQPGLLGEEHNERHNNQQDDDNSDIAVSGPDSGQGGDSTDIETIDDETFDSSSATDAKITTVEDDKPENITQNWHTPNLFTKTIHTTRVTQDTRDTMKVSALVTKDN